LGIECVYSSLTSAGLDGKPELATAVHDRLVQLQNDPALDDTQKAAYAAQAAQLDQVITPDRPIPHNMDVATDAYAGYQVVYVGSGGPNNSYALQDGQGNRVLDANGVTKFRYQSNSYAGLYNALNQIDPNLLTGTTYRP